jgi:hypothetical protein
MIAYKVVSPGNVGNPFLIPTNHLIDHDRQANE